MMVTEPRAASRPATLQPPSPAATDADTAESDASGFLMLLGMFAKPASTTLLPPLGPLAGSATGDAAAGDASTGVLGEAGLAAPPASPDPDSDETGPADALDPLGLKALARALVLARESPQSAPGTRYIGNDRHARTLLARLAAPGGTTYVGTTGAAQSAPATATASAPGVDCNCANGIEKCSPVDALATAPAPATTAAAMIAVAAQQQTQLVTAAGGEAKAPPPSDVPAAIPLTDLTRPAGMSPQTVRAVLALVHALSPSASPALPGVTPVDLPGDKRTDGPAKAESPEAAAASQPMLPEVTVKSVGLPERGRQPGPMPATTTGTSGRDQEHGKRDERQHGGSGVTWSSTTEPARTATAGQGTMFIDAVRPATDAAAGVATPAPAARVSTPVVKAPVAASQVTVELDPATGAGRVRVAIRGDTVHATIITGGTDAAALDGQVHELRRALEARGFAEAHVSVRVADAEGSSPVAATAATAMSGELRTGAARESSHQGHPEQRPPRAPQRNASDQQSPRRRPRREEELV